MGAVRGRTSTVRGKTVLITGGGSGVGAQTAAELRKRGAKLVLTDIDRSALDAVVARLGEDHAMGIVADVTDLDAMDAAVASAVERFGGVDVAVANAGISNYGTILGGDPRAFHKAIDVNLNGVYHTVRAALPSIIDRKGYVLVVSSMAAFAASIDMAAYSASKAAVENFAACLRLEVAHLGVDVGSAHMSWIDTPMVRDANADLPSFGEVLHRLPPPLNTVTSVEQCGTAFVKGIEKRSRRVYCPGWVRIARFIKPLLTMAPFDKSQRKIAADVVPHIDDEVQALGRSVSARIDDQQS